MFSGQRYTDIDGASLLCVGNAISQFPGFIDRRKLLRARGMVILIHNDNGSYYICDRGSGRRLPKRQAQIVPTISVCDRSPA
jgi:hypothetical protein